MEYTIVKNGEVIELPKYSMKIAERLEQVDTINKSAEKFKNKCKSMYELLVEIVGKEKLAELIGKLEDCDPNELNLLYLDVVESYNKPIEEKNTNSTNEKLNSVDIQKMTELLNAIGKSDKVFRVK